MADEHKIHAYGKTVKEIADEIGVSKQAVFKRINRQPLSTKLERLTSTVDGRLMVSVDGEMLIKQAFGAENHKKDRQSSAKTVNHQPSTINQNKTLVDETIVNQSNEFQPKQSPNSEIMGAAQEDEVSFLRKQIVQMNEQILRRDMSIESLNRELEKEREHNREKDKLLMETLSKLAETQAALAVGQSAEKQKELAETLIEGQQKMEDVQAEASEGSYGDLEEFHDTPKKRGWLRRVWDAISDK